MTKAAAATKMCSSQPQPSTHLDTAPEHSCAVGRLLRAGRHSPCTVGYKAEAAVNSPRPRSVCAHIEK